jgi:hypothetical protein
LIHAVTLSVKYDGVNVDLEPRTICKNEVGFRAAIPNLKASVSQGLAQFWKVRDAQDYIDVLVWSCLSTKKRIYSPTAIEPHLDPNALK